MKTKIFENAKQILEQRNCVILIGKEGVGKTAMAVHLMFQYAKCEDYVVRRIRTSHEFYATVDLRINNLIFFDNIFEHSESTKSLWKMFDYMQESMSSCINERFNRRSSAEACPRSKLLIIIASRPREFDDAVMKMNYKHSLLHNCDIDFELEGAELNNFEKRDILEKKMKFALSCQKIEEQKFSDAQWESILMSSTPFGFPLCASLFACDKACRNVGTTFFSNPQNYMLFRVKTIIQADETRRTEVLFILMLVYEIRNEPFYFKESKKYLEVLHELDISEKLKLNDKAFNIEEVVSDHDEVYVRKSQEHILQFTHPSVEEAVQNYFFETYLENAIDMLPLSKLFPKMHSKYFLSLDPIFQKHFIRRLREEIKTGNVCKVCEFRELNNRQVSITILSHLISDASDFKDILNTKNTNNDLPFIYWFTFAANNKTIMYLLRHNTLMTVCSEEELYDQQFFALLASCAIPEKIDVVNFILQKYSKYNIQNRYEFKQAPDSFTENPIKVCFSPLMEAVKTSNDNAILLLTKHKATSPGSIWRGWTFLHACSMYDENQICNREFLQKVFEFEEKCHSNEENKYADIINSDEEITVSEKIVIEVDKSIARHGSHKNILLCLVDIPELEITDALIKAFCLLQDVYKCSNLHSLNFVDENGNTVLHLFLKCRSHDDEEFVTKSKDKADLSETESKIVASTCTLIEEEIPDEDFSFYTYRKNKDKSKKVRTVQRLLAKKVIDTNLKNKKGETPLLIETSKAMPSFDVIKSLLTYGGNPNEYDINGQTCLHRIISQTCASTTEVCNFLSILVQNGADVNKRDIHGNNPIFVEIRNRKPRTEVLWFLLHADINMNLMDANGRTALNVALQNQDYKDEDKIKIIETLLSSKHINVLSRDKTKMSAFSIAISYAERNSELLKRISNHSSCEYPLHECIKEEASEENKIRALKLLLVNDTRELNKQALNEEKETLLITASKFCPDMISLFTFLVDLNIDVNEKDIFENTALDYLIEAPNEFEFRKRKESISCLLSRNPIVHDEDKQERSPMSRVMQFMMSKSYLCQTNSAMAPFQTIERIRNLSHTQSFKKQNVNKLKDIFVDIDIIKKILEITTADLSTYFGEKGRTYLHYCTSTPFRGEHVLAICKCLVALGVDICKRDEDELTCVDIALKYCGKENYDTLVYLLNISKLQDFDVDKALQYLADGNKLHVQIMKYFEENIFIEKIPTINMLHYLASIKFNPELSKDEREELFNCLQRMFAVDEENDDGKIPLHVAIEEDSPVSTVLNFLRISGKCINKADSIDNTALHLVLNSDKADNVVCAIVKQMLEMNADINARNKFLRTPLMVAVKCLKDRSQTVAYILKQKRDVDLCLKDRSGLTILHHCIEAPKNDITACSILSLFLESRFPVPVKSRSNCGLTPLNLAAKHVSYSRILCILRLLNGNDCLIETVDDEGRSPLYNTADSLQGTHPLIVLERIIRSYIFLLHGDSPDYKTNFNDKVLDVCGNSNFPRLSNLLKTDTIKREKVYNIIRPAFDEVARKGLEKNNKIFEELENVDLWGNLLKEENMKTLISNSLPYLSYCKLDQLVNEELGDQENQSSVLDLEHDNDV